MKRAATEQPELPGYESIPDAKVCPARPGRKAHSVIKLHDDPAPWCTWCGHFTEPATCSKRCHSGKEVGG